jgi:hypothetical protein
MYTLYAGEQNINHKSKANIQICCMDAFQTVEKS